MIARGLILAALALLLLPASPARAATAENAAETLSSCLQTRHALSVLVLMDESKSLRDSTDPEDRRIEGLQAALAGLAELADDTSRGARTRIEVLLAGFAGTIDPDPNAERAQQEDFVFPWQRVDRASLDGILARARAFAERDGARDTDYGTALLGARRLLAQHAAEQLDRRAPPSCKALLWFTDGGYNLTERHADDQRPQELPYAPGVKLDSKAAADRAVAAGKDLLCRADGLMDGLVSDEVVTFVVGLSSDFAGADRAFLQSLATGSGDGGRRCGSRVTPATGSYLDAREAADLFFRFPQLIGGPDVAVEPRATAICERTVCERGQTSFRTVAGLSRVQIRATTGEPGMTIVVTAPNGERATLRAGGESTVALAGATLTQRWFSAEAVEVEGTFSTTGDAWIGTWSYAFVDPQARASAAVPQSTSVLFADAYPRFETRPSVVRGARTGVDGRLVRADGSPVPHGELLRSARLAGTLETPDTLAPASVPVTGPAADGAFSAAIRLGAAATAPFVLLTVQADYAAIDGTPIAPERTTVKLATRLPADEGYPGIAPDEVHAVLRGDGTVGVRLTATASADADGCVWVVPTNVKAPTHVSAQIEQRDRRSCLSVAKGQSKDLVVDLEVTDAVTGTARVTLPVTLTSEIGHGERVVDLPVALELYPPIDIPKRIVVIAGLTLLGLALPLAILWLLNFATAWLAAPDTLRFKRIDVQLSPDGELAARDGAPLDMRHNTFATVRPGGERARRARSFAVGPFAIRAVAARRLGDLFRGPHARVTSGAAEVISGGIAARPWQPSDPRARRLALSVAGTWLFTPRQIPPRTSEDAEAPHVEGELVVIVADTTTDIDQGARLLADAAANLTARDWNGPPARQRSARRWRFRRAAPRPAQSSPRPDRVDPSEY